MLASKLLILRKGLGPHRLSAAGSFAKVPGQRTGNLAVAMVELQKSWENQLDMEVSMGKSTGNEGVFDIFHLARRLTSPSCGKL